MTARRNSDIADKLLPQIEEWQKRLPSAVYPIAFIDAVRLSVRQEGVIQELTADAVLGVDEDRKAEVLSSTVGENESQQILVKSPE